MVRDIQHGESVSDWKYHLLDLRTNVWVTRDFPLRDVEITDVLTGHNTITGTVAPERPEFTGQLEDWYWKVALFAEKISEDQIRAGGILTGHSIIDEGNGIALDFAGYTYYPVGQAYGGKFRQWGADAADCLRHIWSWIQARSDSNLGLVVDNDSSRVISDVHPPAEPGRADVTYGPSSPWGTPGDPWPRPRQPRKPKMRKPKKRKRKKNESFAHWEAYLTHYQNALDAWEDAYKAINKDRLPEWKAWHRRLDNMRDDWDDTYGDWEPYKLSWWEATDMGEECARLAQEGNFEWRELHSWGPGKATVNHRLQLGYPTIGVDHPDMMLVVGDELAQYPEVILDGTEFANYVTVLGSGEGRKTRRVTVGKDDGRIRRDVTVRAKRVRRKQRLKRIGNDARSRRKTVREVPEVCLYDAAGTLGTILLGDTVPVAPTSEWDVASATSHRVIGRRYQPDEEDVIYLQLERAERSSEDDD